MLGNVEEVTVSKSNQTSSMFPTVPEIQYAGPDSVDSMSYRYYNSSEVIMGKTMEVRVSTMAMLSLTLFNPSSAGMVSFFGLQLAHVQGKGRGSFWFSHDVASL